MALMFAILLTGAGVGALYGSWAGRLRPRSLVRSAGWLSLALATWPWAISAGVEFGIAYALLLPAIAAWLLVLKNAELRAGRRERRTEAASDGPGERPARSLGRHLGLFLAVVPLSAAAGGLVAAAIARLLPWNEIDATAFVFLSAPLLWGCAATWAATDSRPLRPVAGLVLCGLLSAATIYL